MGTTKQKRPPGRSTVTMERTVASTTLFRQALTKCRGRPAIEPPGDLHVRRRDLDAVHGELRVPRTERHGHPAFAATCIEHALWLDRRHLALELLELRIAAAPLDHLARLPAREHAQLLLQELEPHLPAQSPILL